MFSPTTNSPEAQPYDFEAEENAQKWKTLLIASLQKVQRQVHPSLAAREDALVYIERLILRLLGMLCATQPHSVADVEDRVTKTFPHPIDKWAIGDAQNALDKGRKKSPLVLPVDKIHPLLIKEVLCYKVDLQVTLYIVAVLEYIAADILKLTGNYVKNIKHQEITCQDIKVAMCADKVLMDMFFQDDTVASIASPMEEETPTYVRRGSLTYEEIVKDLVLEETQYMRDLNMIIKVFRAPFVELFPRSKDLDVIFSNILDVQSFTAKMLSMLEDTIEMTQENAVPLVGGGFEELAEGAEFDVYEKYAEDLFKPHGRERLNTLLQRCDLDTKLQTPGHLFKDAFKYVLPKLMLGPMHHCLHYFEVIKVLAGLSCDDDDHESLEQALGLLHQLRLKIDKILGPHMAKMKKPGETSLRFQGRMGHQAAQAKMSDLQKTIDGWEGKDIGQSCNQFIMEGSLSKYAGRRLSDRYVFLFDNLIIFTKPNTRRSSVTNPVGEYKLKERYALRKIDVLDRDDSEELKYSFELSVREHPNIILVAKSQEDKNNWMAALVSLLTRSMLERMLDSVLSEEEKAQPLMLPPPEKYRFSEEDSENNIVFEENQDGSTDSQQIKGGTLLKLVERLTYHQYANLKFLRTFLTTYRSFCKPAELLELLIERFEIPDPPIPADIEDEDPSNPMVRDYLKRFRQKYVKPVQFRVLNVLRHWVDQHFYDFEWDQTLLSRLISFLDTVKGKGMRKWVESINKIIQRRLECPNDERQITMDKQPPPIEWHIARQSDEFELMTLHPIEIARQVTLLEFDLYKAVKSSELVGSVWNKKDKNNRAPNLLKMIHHSTMFTYWLEKCIIEAENFEERVAVLHRIIEILIVFQELNNFNGVLEVVGALHSAPVFRLDHTFAEMPTKLERAYEEAKELNTDHFKKYIEKLRSINPPCVPFLGMYLTNILHTEEGNLDFLPNRPEGIINFSKRRKVAEITSEIHQYQNQPYCLTAENDIREFFENLNPLGDMTEKEFNDYLYEKSLEIEPRNSKAPSKCEKKWDYSLKSPGIKPQSSRQSQSGLGSRSHSTAFTFPTRGIPEGNDMDMTSSRGATPPTPSTPLTPPHGSTTASSNSVFAMVSIGPTSGTTQSPVNVTSPMTGIAEEDAGAKPPPLPPRRPRESSVNDFGSNLTISRPALPPRDLGAPPIPPRNNSTSQLNRAVSMTIPRATQMAPDGSVVSLRRHSERGSEQQLFNGGGPMPQIPPRSRSSQIHARKQSS